MGQVPWFSHTELLLTASLELYLTFLKDKVDELMVNMMGMYHCVTPSFFVVETQQ